MLSPSNMMTSKMSLLISGVVVGTVELQTQIDARRMNQEKQHDGFGLPFPGKLNSHDYQNKYGETHIEPGSSLKEYDFLHQTPADTFLQMAGLQTPATGHYHGVDSRPVSFIESVGIDAPQAAAGQGISSLIGDGLQKLHQLNEMGRSHMGSNHMERSDMGGNYNTDHEHRPLNDQSFTGFSGQERHPSLGTNLQNAIGSGMGNLLGNRFKTSVSTNSLNSLSTEVQDVADMEFGKHNDLRWKDSGVVGGLGETGAIGGSLGSGSGIGSHCTNSQSTNFGGKGLTSGGAKGSAKASNYWKSSSDLNPTTTRAFPDGIPSSAVSGQATPYPWMFMGGNHDGNQNHNVEGGNVFLTRERHNQPQKKAKFSSEKNLLDRKLESRLSKWQPFGPEDHETYSFRKNSASKNNPMFSPSNNGKNSANKNYNTKNSANKNSSSKNTATKNSGAKAKLQHENVEAELFADAYGLHDAEVDGIDQDGIQSLNSESFQKKPDSEKKEANVKLHHENALAEMMAHHWGLQDKESQAVDRLNIDNDVGRKNESSMKKMNVPEHNNNHNAIEHAQQILQHKLETATNVLNAVENVAKKSGTAHRNVFNNMIKTAIDVAPMNVAQRVEWAKENYSAQNQGPKKTKNNLHRKINLNGKISNVTDRSGSFVHRNGDRTQIPKMQNAVKLPQYPAFLQDDSILPIDPFFPVEAYQYSDQENKPEELEAVPGLKKQRMSFARGLKKLGQGIGLNASPSREVWDSLMGGNQFMDTF